MDKLNTLQPQKYGGDNFIHPLHNTQNNEHAYKAFNKTNKYEENLNASNFGSSTTLNISQNNKYISNLYLEVNIKANGSDVTLLPCSSFNVLNSVRIDNLNKTYTYSSNEIFKGSISNMNTQEKRNELLKLCSGDSTDEVTLSNGDSLSLIIPLPILNMHQRYFPDHHLNNVIFPNGKLNNGLDLTFEFNNADKIASSNAGDLNINYSKLHYESFAVLPSTEKEKSDPIKIYNMYDFTKTHNDGVNEENIALSGLNINESIHGILISSVNSSDYNNNKFYKYQPIQELELTNSGNSLYKYKNRTARYNDLINLNTLNQFNYDGATREYVYIPMSGYDLKDKLSSGSYFNSNNLQLKIKMGDTDKKQLSATFIYREEMDFMNGVPYTN